MEVSTPNKQWWLIALTIVVIVVILGGVGYWWWLTHEHTVRLPDGTPKVVAPADKVISDFPTDMILEPDARIAGSYSLSYSSGSLRYPIVQYISAKSYAENVAAFKKYLDDNNWEVSHYGDAAQTPSTYFYAYKGNNETGITLAQGSDAKVTVTITYVAR